MPESDIYTEQSRQIAIVTKAFKDLSGMNAQLRGAVGGLTQQLAVANAASGASGSTTEVVTTIPAPRTRAAVIGAQWVEQSTALIDAALKGAPASFINVWQYGKTNKVINLPGAYGVYTTSNVAQARNGGAEPDLWIIDLGEMHDQASTTDAMVQVGDLSNEMMQVDEVLAALGPTARVMWVAQANQWSYPSAYGWIEKLNAAIRQRMTSRGVNGYFADWWTWARDNRGASPMPTAAQKATWLGRQADAYMRTLTITTTTQVASSSSYVPTAFDAVSLLPPE